MIAWPGEWRVEEVLDGGAPDCPSTGKRIYIVAEGGWVAEIKPCSNPQRAFGDSALPTIGDVPGTEGYSVGLEIARATAKEIVAMHNAMSNDQSVGARKNLPRR